jgi:hypothetical protein
VDIVKNFLEQDGAGVIDAVAARIGVDSDSITSIINGLVPELNSGVQAKISAGPAGFGSLLEGVDMGALGKLVVGDDSVDDAESQSVGSALLDNIFGGEQGTAQLLEKLSGSTGITIDKIQEAIPQLTSSFISYFSKSSGGIGEMMSSLSNPESLMASMSSLLDSDGDGDVSDDLLEAAKKLF